MKKQRPRTVAAIAPKGMWGVPVLVTTFAVLLSCVPTGSERPAEKVVLPDRLVILKELRTRDFSALEKRFVDLQERFEADPRWEPAVEAAFRTFWIADPTITEPIDEWIAAHPMSYSARLAKARHFGRKAMDARGGGWAKDTSPEQFRQMRAHLETSVREVARAIDLNPHLMEAYAQLISAMTMAGPAEACHQVAEQALRFENLSVRVREKHLDCISPRWRGSIEEMTSFIAESVTYEEENPRLGMLRGYVKYELGLIAMASDRSREAVEAFTAALTATPSFWSYYRARGDAYFRMKAYSDSLADLDRANELLPQNPRTLIDRLYTLLKMKNGKAAASTVAEISALDPTHPDLAGLRDETRGLLLNDGYRLFQAKRFEEALGFFDLVIEFDPHDYQAYYYRGHSYLELGDGESALREFEEAIRREPSHFKSYRAVDVILSRTGEWSLILDYWNQYLELEPTDAQGYLERAGTYKHHGDLQAAMADLLKSCKLGNREACDIFQRERGGP